MKLLDLVKQLVALTEPDRQSDQEIALQLGFRRKSGNVQSEDGNTERRITWYSPKGSDIGAAPMFTATLDAAKIASDLICPSDDVAVSWVTNRGYAKIGAGRNIKAANPAIALCVAALVAKLERELPPKDSTLPPP